MRVSTQAGRRLIGGGRGRREHGQFRQQLAQVDQGLGDRGEWGSRAVGAVGQEGGARGGQGLGDAGDGVVRAGVASARAVATRDNAVQASVSSGGTGKPLPTRARAWRVAAA